MAALSALLVHSTCEGSFLRKGLNPADEFIAPHALQYRTLLSELQGALAFASAKRQLKAPAPEPAAALDGRTIETWYRAFRGLQRINTHSERCFLVDPRDVTDLSAWERWVAHAGYLSEGALYLLIGAFGLLATIDASRHPNGSQGVLISLSRSVPGDLLLAAVTLGLASFVIWQLLIAIRDPERRRDRDRRLRWIIRLGHLLSGALHSVLVIEAMRILFGFGSTGGGERSQKEWIGRAFGMPLGRYVVGIVGIGISIYGLYQCYRAVTRDKDRRVDLARTRLRPILEILGVFGLFSRGVMFAVIGAELARAAWRVHAQYAVGIAGALGTLRQQPYGEWVLGTVTTGLISYGLWQIAKEPYRRLRDS